MTSASPASDALSAIDACGIVAIIRGPFLADIDRIVDGLIDGGIRAIEISLTSPDALAQIERAVARAGSRAAIGAGTVMSARDVEDVHQKGATFVVSPALEGGVMAETLARSLLPLPGAYTPTEILTAVRLGAPAVKLFPSDTLDPAYVRALLTPLPALKLVPTGGVTLERAAAFADAGAWAVGVGSPLVRAPLDQAALAVRAAAFVGAMRPGSR